MKRNLLVIDDDIDGSALIKAHYTKKDCSVETAATLKEGIDKLNENTPDILFLDHNLPDGLGWGMAAKMQKTFPGMKIVLLTAFDAPPYPVSDADIQFIRLEKPFTLDRLDAILL
jgi:two-component system OmpR family response regulator